jgi:transglutaminase-like putative cysteine protease
VTELITGCSSETALSGEKNNFSGVQSSKDATGDRDNTPVVLVPEATGQEVYASGDVSVDASNTSEGYFMVSYTGTAAKVRMLVDTPEGNQYNYLLPLDGAYVAYPLSEGSGTYQIGVYENITDDKYAQVYSQSVTAQITDEKSPFLYPSEYVDFNGDTKAVAKAAELAAGASDDLAVVEAVYDFVITHVSYDYDKAETVQSGYLPVVDDTLASGTGICFDYASLMAAMLRSQRIPTKLEIGYVDDTYHAWVSIYLEEQGWVENMIYFDGTKWSIADPTLASYATDDVVKDHMDNADSLYEIKYKY